MIFILFWALLLLLLLSGALFLIGLSIKKKALWQISVVLFFGFVIALIFNLRACKQDVQEHFGYQESNYGPADSIASRRKVAENQRWMDSVHNEMMKEREKQSDSTINTKSKTGNTKQ